MMRRTLPTTTKLRLIGLLAVAGLVAGACGGGDDDVSEATDGPDETEATEETEAPPDTEAPTDTTTNTSGAQVGFDQVQPAVVQIIAEGTIRDPELGVASNAGSGSGFIISPDGIAVTNNHVVTGAATLEVYVGGELDKSFNAVVLGVSECNDLAVIDITEDEPLPYLEWYDGDLRPGSRCTPRASRSATPSSRSPAASWPRPRRPAKRRGRRSTRRSSTTPTSSPATRAARWSTAEGQVAAVNYADAARRPNTSQFFAISKELAQPVVERLIDGDFEALGINGQAVFDEAAEISGIWVAGVAPGSPASDTGILPGDIVTTLNGLPIGGDGTYSDYCDVLRTSGDRPISVEVLRYDTSEVLRGELTATSRSSWRSRSPPSSAKRSPTIPARPRSTPRSPVTRRSPTTRACSRSTSRTSGPTSTPPRSRSTTAPRRR